MEEKRFVIPEIIATHFHFRLGDKVGDFGSGSGPFLRVFSNLVGPEGFVYACEIQKNLAEMLQDRVRREHLNNVEVIWGDLEEINGTKIENETLDAGVLVNCLFQVEDKETTIKEVMRTLRSGGKLIVIDWSESWGGMGPQPAQVINESEARALCEGQGLTFEREFDAGGHHYGLAFRKG